MSGLEVVMERQGHDANLKAAKKVVKILNQADYKWLRAGVVGVKLVDDESIRGLNKDYSGEDKTTDVLSFNYQEAGQMIGAEHELGDVVVSLETAERQAEAAGTTLEEELALLVLHGILHIHGFDHANAGDQESLGRLQKEILNQAGLTYRNFNWV